MIYERDKKFENKLKRKWPAKLIRFTADWRAPFTIGRGGVGGVETDTQVHDLFNATCFGVFIRFHKNLLNDWTNIDYQDGDDSNEEVSMEGGAKALQDPDEEHLMSSQKELRNVLKIK